MRLRANRRVGTKDETHMLLFRNVSSVLIRSISESIGAKAVENGAVPTPGFKGINERGISVAVVDCRSRHNHGSDSTYDGFFNNNGL